MSQILGGFLILHCISLDIFDGQNICVSDQMCKHFQIWLLFEIEDIFLHKAIGICIGDSEDLLLSAKEGIP